MVFVQQFANFHLDQFEQFRVVHLISFVQKDQNRGDLDLMGQQNVFVRLGHRAIGSADDQDCTINLGSTGDHVLDIVAMTRHVHMGIMAFRGFVFNMGNVDRNTAGFLFRRIVN
jgi:hypothetical protein